MQDSSKLSDERSSSNRTSKSKLNGQNLTNENDKSLSNSDANMDDDVRLGEVISAKNSKSMSRTTSQGMSKRSKTDSLKRAEHDSNFDAIQSNQQFNNAQLVRIQKFSFFKWEINVDTLVRLFIVA